MRRRAGCLWLCLLLLASPILAYGGALLLITAAGHRLLAAWVNRMQPALNGSFQCERVQVTPMLCLRLMGISASLPYERGRLIVAVDAVELRNSLWNIWRTRQLRGALEGGTLSARRLLVHGLDITYDGALPGVAVASAHPVGFVRVRSAQFGDLGVTQLAGAVVQTADGYALESLTLQALSGTLRGRLAVTTHPALRYALELQAQDCRLGDLELVNREMFHNAAGLLQGMVRVSGDDRTVMALAGTLTVNTPGGSIGAQLLEALVPYLPRTVERQRLEAVIAKRELVPFESASLTVTAADPQHLRSVLNMAIPEYNLLLDHITIDIRLDDPQWLPRVLGALRQLTE